MFKLVALSALLAVASAAPGLLSAYNTGFVGSVPTSVSQQSSSVVHSAGLAAAPVVSSYAAAPVVSSLAAAPVIGTHGQSLSYGVGLGGVGLGGAGQGVGLGGVGLGAVGLGYGGHGVHGGLLY